MTPEWMTQAACALPDNRELPWVEPLNVTTNEVAQMRAVCHGCPVRRECEADRREHGDRYGFRAGRLWGSNVKDPTRTCICCGTLFEPVTNSKTCSEPCRKQHLRDYNRAYWQSKKQRRRRVS